jgi:hypothetical protein
MLNAPISSPQKLLTTPEVLWARNATLRLFGCAVIVVVVDPSVVTPLVLRLLRNRLDAAPLKVKMPSLSPLATVPAALPSVGLDKSALYVVPDTNIRLVLLPDAAPNK